MGKPCPVDVYRSVPRSVRQVWAIRDDRQGKDGVESHEIDVGGLSLLFEDGKYRMHPGAVADAFGKVEDAFLWTDEHVIVQEDRKGVAAPFLHHPVSFIYGLFVVAAGYGCKQEEKE